MNINEKEIEQASRKIDLGGFNMNDELNPKIWDKEEKMRSDVKKTLLKIADDYFESLDLPGVDIEDVTMTGSLANYNWSKYSDVDLHIVVDYDDLPMDRELVQDFLKSKSSAWNKEHDVKIYGYDVELYVQDINEPHHSTGVYSVLNNEWNIKPEKKKISFSDKSVIDKANRLMDRIEDIYDDMGTDDNEDIIKRVDKLTEKIKKMRQSGLESGGEFSVENIVFKVLRRNGMLDRLYDIKTVAYDKSVTLESENLDRLIESLDGGDDFDWIRDVEPNDLPKPGTAWVMEINPSDFERVQQDLFDIGFEWAFGGNKIRETSGVVALMCNEIDDIKNNHIKWSLNGLYKLKKHIEKTSGIVDKLYVYEYENGVSKLKKIIDFNKLNESDDFDWIRDIEPTYIPKVGDRVRCKPGFSNNTKNIAWFKSPTYAGAGYREGKEFIVGSVSKETSDLHEIYGEAYITWPENDHLGVFNWALEPVTLNSVNESDELDWIRGVDITNHMEPPYFKNMKEYGLSPNEYNSVLSKTFNQPVKYGVTVQGYAIHDKQGNKLYRESSVGDWIKREYDEQGNRIYYEDSDGKIKDYRHLNESDEMDWIKDVKVNPFSTNPLVVIKFDNPITTGEAEQILYWLKEIDSNVFKNYDYITPFVKYSNTGGYIYSYMSLQGYMDFGFGSDVSLFNRYKYDSIKPELSNTSYKEYKSSELFRNNINESDDMDWIRDTKPSLNMDSNWMLINDVDPNSYEESKLIQEFLFDLGYKWYSSKGVQQVKINDIQHFNSESLKGDLTYCSPNEKSMTECGMKNHENIYYWSEIKPNNLNESDDFDWIRDTGLPSEYEVDFKKGRHHIKVDGLTTDEKEKIQQIILNKGITWGDLDKNVKKGEHYTDEGVYYYLVSNGFLLVGRGPSEEEDIKYLDGGLFLDYNRHTINESDDFDWVKNINPIPLEKNDFVSLNNLIWDYFDTNGLMTYGGWSYGIFNNGREIIWTHPDFEDLIIMATPFSDDEYSMSIEFQEDFAGETIDTVKLPIFKHESELTDWLSNEYPQIVLETIEWGMGDYTDEIYLRNE